MEPMDIKRDGDESEAPAVESKARSSATINRFIAIMLFLLGAVLATAGAKSASSILGAVVLLFCGIVVCNVALHYWRKAKRV
jgi:hypothetical protein